MLRIKSLNPTLDLADSRPSALMRIAIGLIVILIVISVALTANAAQTTLGADIGWWLIVVLAFVPYFVSSWRSLRHDCELHIDWERRQLRFGNKTTIPFTDVYCLEMITVNGRCEEALLQAILVGGDTVKIMSDRKFSVVRRIAVQLSQVCSVALYLNPVHHQGAFGLMHRA